MRRTSWIVSRPTCNPFDIRQRPSRLKQHWIRHPSRLVDYAVTPGRTVSKTSSSFRVISWVSTARDGHGGRRTRQNPRQSRRSQAKKRRRSAQKSTHKHTTRPGRVSIQHPTTPMIGVLPICCTSAKRSGGNQQKADPDTQQGSESRK